MLDSGLSDRGLRVLESGLGLFDRDVAFRIVDFRQQLTFLHSAATVDVERLHEPRNLRKQLGIFERANRARLVGRPLHPAALGRDHLHRRLSRV